MGNAREIFLRACDTIAVAFAPDGYHWVKSQNCLVREDGPLSFQLQLQSSPRNIILSEDCLRSEVSPPRGLLPGEQVLFVPLPVQLQEISSFGMVKMIPHFGVKDDRIAAWRKTLSNPIRSDNGVTGGNLGYLAKEHAWLEINLANPQTRNSRIASLINLFRQGAFPFFDRFRRDGEILDTLIHSGFEPAMEFAEVEHAVFLGGADAGRKVIARYLRKWPAARSKYDGALAEFRKSGIPETWDASAGPRLAKAALSLGIEI